MPMPYSNKTKHWMILGIHMAGKSRIFQHISTSKGTQQDNARLDVAKVPIEYLQEENIEILPWPSKSPDLNQIEDLSDELERRLRHRQQAPTSLQNLQDAVQEELNNIL